MTAARDFLEAVQQRADAATDGPWEAYDSNEGTGYLPLWSVANDAFHNPPDDEDASWIAADVHVGMRADAEFIAASRTDVPRLVAALTAVLDVAEEMDRSPQTWLDEATAAMLRFAITDALTPKENS